LGQIDFARGEEGIDWQILFRCHGSLVEYPRTLHFVWKLLKNDPGTLSLLVSNLFPPARLRVTFAHDFIATNYVIRRASVVET